MTHEQYLQTKEDLKISDTILEELDTKRYDLLETIKNNIIEVINQYLIEDAKIKYPQLSFYSDKEGLEFRCEIGFEESPDRFNFGSTFDFYFEGGKIYINKGTMGHYGLEDIYQCKRDAAVYHILYLNGTQLTADLNACYVSEISELTDAYYKQSAISHDLNKQCTAYELEEINKSIKVGNIYKYDPEAENYRRLSQLTGSYYRDDIFTITKVTNKYVHFSIKNTLYSEKVANYPWVNENLSDKCKKEIFIYYLNKNAIKEVKE